MRSPKKRNKTDNRGSALLMVIIVLSFIAVLGLTVQAAALVNRRMKNVDQASKDNFYSAEAALEEIKTNLETRMTVCANLAYQEVLKNYSKFTAMYYSTIQLQEYFRKQTIRNMCDLTLDNGTLESGTAGGGYLAGYSASGALTVTCSTEHKKNITELLKAYTDAPEGTRISINKKYDPADAGGTAVYAPDFAADTAEFRYVIFKNISVEYIKNGYISTITTDIRVKVPDIVIDPVNYAKSTVFLDYIFITDGKLEFEGNGPADVKGNLYSKGGISIDDNKKLEIRADKLISGGDVTLGTGSDVMVKELLADKAAIWANGFTTEKALSSEPPPTYLTLNGTVNLADDLTLNARGSQAVINGEYYGFGNDGTAESGKSSAIAVNGASSRLKLNVSRLLLAGRNYISHSKVNAGGGANADYLTGEGLALKSNQLAYLVPEEYMKVGHNPVMGSEYNAYRTNIVNHTELLKSLGAYLNSYNPYKAVFYHAYGSLMVYYYLNFKDADAVKDYFLEYVSLDENLAEMEEVFLSDGIEIAAGCEIITDSNIITYDTDAQGIHLNVTSGGEDAAIKVTEKAGEKQKSYYYMMHTLGYIPPAGTETPDSVFEWLIDTGNLERLKINGNYENKFINVISESGHGAVAADEDIDTGAVPVGKEHGTDLTKKITSGLIVSGGTVTVSEDFTGLIIAKDGIVVRSGASYAANSVIAGNIIENSAQYQVELNQGVKGTVSMEALFHQDVLNIQLSTGTTGKAMYVDLSDLVSYENWSKN